MRWRMGAGMAKPNFYDRLAELDGLLKAGPGAADMTVFKTLTADKTLYEYAFEHLSDPNWIAPLRAAGFFTSPPGVIEDRTRGITSYPWWPESRFLARVASAAPELVADIFVSVPLTENGRVHADAIEAANHMSVQFATRVVSRELDWLKKQEQLSFLIPKKLAELIRKLAAGGEADTAFAAFTVLLEVFPASRARPTSAARSSEDASSLGVEVRARVSSWEYGNALDVILSEIVAVRPLETFSFLCSSLERAVSGSRASDASPPEDYSYVWRRSIGAEDDAHPDIKNRLVTAVRDVARIVAASSEEALQSVLSELGRHTWNVFERVALDVLAAMPNASVQVVRVYLTNRKYFDHSSFESEYRAALRTHFARLGSQDKAEFLDWIDRGPDIAAWKQFHIEWTKRVITARDEREYVDRWQLAQLEPISVFLEGRWRERWDTLTAQYGVPAAHGVSGRGALAEYEVAESPRTADELARFTVTELTAFLREWRPSPDTKATVEGLVRSLSEAVSAKPEKYWDQATSFCELPLVYIHPIINSSKNAIRSGTRIPWPELLGLCEYVVTNEAHALVKIEDDKRVLAWTEQSVAELLSGGLESSSIAIDQRERVWRLLEELLGADDPTPDAEDGSVDSGTDAATLSLNATRSVALHATVRYALWVRKAIEDTPDGAPRLENGFDEMPEVREALNRHLDTERERSVAVRAVYGQWFPWLTLLDTRWAAAAAATIFPAGDEHRRLWNAAWNTYITFCRPYDNVFDVLREQYALAVSRVSAATTVKSDDVDAKLAEHLMVLYWRGKIQLPPGGNLLSEFYARASRALATHALAFVGQSLTGTRDPVPPAIIARLQQLWESRVATAEASGAIGTFQSELASFGWWFASARFPVVWATDQLIRVLRRVGTIDGDYQVVRQLPAIASEHPSMAIEALRLLFESDKEGLADGWELYPRITLEAALKSPEAGVKELVDEAIDDLGARGHLEFRDLLSRQ